MLIYNMTIQIEWTIQPLWLSWMQEEYIKLIMSSGCFTKYQLVRLVEIDEDVGPTYALQLYAANRENYNQYIENYLSGNDAASYEKWGNNAISFSTLMEVVGE